VITNNSLPSIVEFYDTTLRDGAQTRGIQFSLQDKLNIIDLLDDFGMDIIECGWNGANATDTDLYKIISKRHCKNSELAAFTSSCSVGKTPETDIRFQQGVNANVPVITMFSKFWDFQITQTLNTTIEHNLELIFKSVAYCKSRFDKVIVDAEHFFDGYKSSPSIAISAIKTALDAGADRLVLCDTNGGTLPTEVSSILKQLNTHFDKASFGIHCHNDTDMAVANSIAAVEQGVMQVQGTINGIGERCGNTNLCSLIPNLTIKYGLNGKYINKTKLSRLRHMANSVSSICHRLIPPTQPYVGDHAFTHKAGVHISSVLKYPECYEHVSPESVGNNRHLPISEQSGRAAMKYRLKKMGYENIDHSTCQNLLKQVKDRCYYGVLLDDADASLELLVHQHMHVHHEWSVQVALEHMSITEIHSINSESHYRLEVAMNVNGEIIFYRDFGVDLQTLCHKIVSKIFQKAFYSYSRLTISVDRVDTLEQDHKRVFISFVQNRKVHKICAVEHNEMRAICRAIIDVYIWKIYVQEQPLGLSEVAQ